MLARRDSWLTADQNLPDAADRRITARICVIISRMTEPEQPRPFEYPPKPQGQYPPPKGGYPGWQPPYPPPGGQPGMPYPPGAPYVDAYGQPLSDKSKLTAGL